MLWKKKPQAEEPFVQLLASQLGVERRQNVRVNYPERTTACLPAISVKDRRLRVHDISVGGCCLIDQDDCLGPNVGIELTLQMAFPNQIDEIRARLVGSVDKRRHIQFLNLAPARVDQLKAQMVFGIRALGVKAVFKSAEAGPALHAREIWNSMQGDALIIEDGVHLRAHAEIAGEIFYFLKGARPQDRHQAPVSDAKLLSLVLFLANIKQQSADIKQLLTDLEEIILEGQG